MSMFLSLKSAIEAKLTIAGIAHLTESERISLSDSCGRILAEDIISKENIPGFSRSVVDGYAILSTDSVGAGESIPAILKFKGRVEMGTISDAEIKSGTCIYVPTGGNVPNGADAVAMIEYCEQIGEEVLVYRPLASGENIVFADEDFAEGKKVMDAGTLLRPQECGVLAALGFESINVLKKPVIGIISTGNELVEISEKPCFGKVRDVNTTLCSAFVRIKGCNPKIYGIISDEKTALESVIIKAAEECDAILISGGSSKDERDNTSMIIENLGRLLIHGISISPGKPTIIGEVYDKPVIGLPGHPSSAYVILSVIVSELLSAMQGQKNNFNTIKAKLSENVPSAEGREDYVRVLLSDGFAKPLYSKSGLLNTLTNSNAVIRIPAGSEGLEAGDEVEAILW
ncbi:MAG: molybdopterin molybdotransferase MoeA [Methanomicrobiaceae archaeon]|nr:molybdopterin molybdotransferase MoeA [Methanomicrobiaceae archaeon]